MANFKIKNMLILLFVIIIPLTGWSKAARGTPVRAIQDVDDKLSRFKTGKLSKKEREYNEQLKKDIIRGAFDVNELAKLSLSKHWNNLTVTEQEHVVQVMTDLLEVRALFAKEQSAARSIKGGKYYVKYYGSRFLDEKKDRSKVITKVIVPSENIDIALNYKLMKEKGKWKIYDVVVDEASLVSNYRYQFNAIINKHGYPELVRRMENKLNEIREQRDAGLEK